MEIGSRRRSVAETLLISECRFVSQMLVVERFRAIFRPLNNVAIRFVTKNLEE